jgi:hypothetical protein
MQVDTVTICNDLRDSRTAAGGAIAVLMAGSGAVYPARLLYYAL